MPLDIEYLRSALPGHDIHYFESIGSTMTEGARLAQEGAPQGTVVLAEEQLSGVGRLGRKWESERDVGLYSSTLLRLPVAPASLPVASLLIGLAAAEAIERSTQLNCDLRWPNDVLIEERKVAGILPHLVAGCVVAGVGINVNNQSFAAGLRTPAISLALAGGTTVAREQVFIHLMQALDSLCEILVTQGTSPILRAFTRASSYVLQRRVVVEETGLCGVTKGLDENGFLLLETERGAVERVASGGVRPAA